MKNYENDYEKIRSTFVMDDRDAHPFNPSSKSFEKDAIEYALRRAFRDFNFRTLTAIKSDASEGFVCEFDTWQKTQNDAKKLAKDGKQKNEIPVSRTDYLVEKLSKVKFCTRFAEYFQDNSPKANLVTQWYLFQIHGNHSNLCNYRKALIIQRPWGEINFAQIYEN